MKKQFTLQKHDFEDMFFQTNMNYDRLVFESLNGENYGMGDGGWVSHGIRPPECFRYCFVFAKSRQN
jgi:hypothetical protein